MDDLRSRGTGRTASLRRIDPLFAGLSLTEFWERFALAGVKSMLTLLLIDHVLHPNADVQGVGWLRSLLAWDSSDSPGDVGLASQIYGFANALVYLSIPLGGLIGDVLIGRRASVLAGGASMILGLLLMISLQGFLPGLALFAAGTGLLKGNLSVQFGTLFADEGRRRRAYAYYLVFLNAGVVCGPLAMGALALWAGWQTALGLAAAGIAAGMLIYIALLGKPKADARSRPRSPAGEDATDIAMDRGTPFAMVRLIIAMLAIYLCFAAYGQIGNIVLVWTQQRVDLDVASWQMPVGWVLALDGLLTILLVFAVQAGFRALHRRGIDIGPLSQIALGCAACAGGYLVLVAAEWLGDAPLSLIWVLAYLALVDLAIVLVWPSGLSLATGLAPRGQAGLWVGLFYLHGFFANLWVGFAGGFYEEMGMIPFWVLHASIALGGGVIAVLAALSLALAHRRYQAITTSA